VFQRGADPRRRAHAARWGRPALQCREVWELIALLGFLDAERGIRLLEAIREVLDFDPNRERDPPVADGRDLSR
jgi:hypothetical protein